MELTKQPSESFGFYVWFDDQGHYIEDVTIGSIADKAGLKSGDRVKEVNFRKQSHKIFLKKKNLEKILIGQPSQYRI